ncbi:FIVAR domain-containing protein [Mycoplasma tullyi]|uniref:FIVAR domain-containing protein n=1 Tax=Mycoplasma tullyi TaxID=1612150 RepID=A0A7D7U3E5_9MOLU|nr:FIVAR domain-containing protein [Mycoplasma tullyi]QMT98272.1 FIVAR domain-containing protein [Mycoplasma tullyi]
MKRKNIIKFVSLLGISSFVMLAAASCTQAITLVPNSGSTSADSSSNTNPTAPSRTENKVDMPSMDTTPSNNQGTIDVSSQELANAKSTLNTLLNDQSQKVELYADYAKIQDNLVSAYNTAKETADSSTATVEQVKEVTSTLQTAIDNANAEKLKFDEANKALLAPYNDLKNTVNQKQSTLASLKDPKYSAILNKINSSYQQAEQILRQTLDPVSGTIPTVELIQQASQSIQTVMNQEELTKQKENADSFANSKLYKLDKTKLTGITTATMQQPANYSFVGYSVDLSSSVNWSFAERTVLANATTPTIITQSTQTLTDVAWIYNLGETGAKYTLDFIYYGPSTAYLYFPYKLVKTGDANMVGLQYKLNDNETQTPITFGTENNLDGKTPTVSDINVAKLTLSNLNFGENKIEFSVPDTKVAPMIGNMYLTSNSGSESKINDQIFGNTENINDTLTAITVDLLKGYSLAADWSTDVVQFTNLANSMPANAMTYLVGIIGGTVARPLPSSVPNRNNTPANTNTARTFTIYVNAPKDGDYYISGSYLTSNSRGLKLSIDNTNSVTVTVTGKTNWNTLGYFDTSKTNNSTGNEGSVANNKTTLTLKQGLNKVVISPGTEDSMNAPYIGNLTFTLNSTSTNSGQDGSSSLSS